YFGHTRSAHTGTTRERHRMASNDVRLIDITKFGRLHRAATSGPRLLMALTILMVFFGIASTADVYSRVDGFIDLSFAAVFLVILVLWKATPRLGTMLAVFFMLLTLLPYGFLAVGDVFVSGRVHMTFWIPTVFSVMIMRAAVSTQRYRRVSEKAH